MTGEKGTDQPKKPLREIIQPFIDLAHAPRALWGINLAYVIEGMCYFGMLGYLTIYCSDTIFQAIDGANELAHLMVMVLTAGITIAMFFLGVVADKRGVRFAIIAAFLCMVMGRFVWAGVPLLFGLEPIRPGVFAGDKVSLHVTELDSRFGNKCITKAEVFANDVGGGDTDRAMRLDIAAGEGLVPSEAIESRLVRLEKARLVKGEDQEWTVRYGSKPVTARALIRSAEGLRLGAGSLISLDQAYIASREKKKETTPEPDGSQVDGGKEEDESGMYEHIIRSHWLSDVKAIRSFPVDLAEGDGVVPDGTRESWRVRLSQATLLEGEGAQWDIRYGQKAVTARLLIDSSKKPPLGPGATISIHRAEVIKQQNGSADEFAIRVEWPAGFAAVDVSGCENADVLATAIKEQLIPDLAVGQGTPPGAELASDPVQLGEARLVKRDGDVWQVQYGRAPVTARLEIVSGKDAPLGAGALISLSRADVVQDGGDATGFMLRAEWPDDVVAVDTYGCEESPYRGKVTADEKSLKAESRAAITAETEDLREAAPITLGALRGMKDGPVDVVLRDVTVTYVRNGGYFLQASEAGPAVFVFVSPLWSSLQIVTLLGMILVVVGYGMYQPAAYAAVRKFTTPKTAAMGFAMLYALMNLGGWLPTFAFMLRDDDYLGLGISGVFCVYAGFTVIALIFTVLILSRRTVAKAEAAAKEETARIKAEEKESKKGKNPEADAGTSVAAEIAGQPRVKPHMWLFWLCAMPLFLFKSEAPWYYTWTEGLWRYIIVGAIFVSPVPLGLIPKARNWIARHPLQDVKFAFFIFALIPVQTLFTYNWLVLPPYIHRAFDGWIGNYFEIAANANPLLIFVAVPLIAAVSQRVKVYNMMVCGTFVMAAPAFLLAIGPHWYTLAGYLLIMTIGEAMWQPRFLQYAAEIAPEGRTGEYMGVAQLPWFLTKVLVPLLYSGTMMDRFCPADGPKNTEVMWLIFACIAMLSPITLVLARGWVGKDFKTKAD